MKNRTTLYLIFLTLIIVIWIVSLCVMTISHEEMHREIYKSYGIESKTVWNTRLVGSYIARTFPVNYNDSKSKCGNACQSLHTNNEIIGYNALFIVNTIYLIFFSFIIYKFVMEAK